MSCGKDVPSTSYQRCEGVACREKAKNFQCCNSVGSNVSLVQQLVSSCTGAIVTALLMTPMDVVKIRLQRQAHVFPPGQCFFYHNGLMDHVCVPCAEKQPCEWYQRPGNFTGTVDAFVKISRQEGIRSLWSGLSPTLVMAVPATVFYFSVYDNLLNKFKRKICCRRTRSPDKWTPPEWTVAPAAGAIARTISVTITSPLEMIRTKMQSEQMNYKDVGKAIKSSMAVRGYSSFYLGWAPTLLRDIPFSAFYWGGYDFLKQNVLKWKGLKDTTFSIAFCCGAASGVCASILTTPFDVVKTHRQIALGSSQLAENIPARRVFMNILRKSGPQALFAGVVPRTVKVAPACAIMIGSYEFFKLYFSHRNQKY